METIVDEAENIKETIDQDENMNSQKSGEKSSKMIEALCEEQKKAPSKAHLITGNIDAGTKQVITNVLLRINLFTRLAQIHRNNVHS